MQILLFSSTPSISQYINYAIKRPTKNSVWLQLLGPSNERFSNALSFIHVIPFLAVFDVIRCTLNYYTYGPTQTIWSFRANARTFWHYTHRVTTLMNSNCDKKSFKIRKSIEQISNKIDRFKNTSFFSSETSCFFFIQLI